MRIVVHPPTVTAPDGTEHVAAVVVAAVAEQVRRLREDGTAPTTTATAPDGTTETDDAGE